MQRVRIGLTGLAFVFVLVLLAAVFTSPSEEEPITANSIERQIRIGAATGGRAEGTARGARRRAWQCRLEQQQGTRSRRRSQVKGGQVSRGSPPPGRRSP